MTVSNDEPDRPSRARSAPRGTFVTSADVASLAGVSRSAVSRTFTPGASVSEDLRSRVLAAADELGYKVNRLARGLISAQSSLVGLISANLDTPFQATLLSKTIAALATRGLHPLVFEMQDAYNKYNKTLQHILEFRVEAVVVMSGTPPQRIVDECLSNGVRLVLVNRLTVGVPVPTIVSDDLVAAATAADRLYSAGCRRLGFVGSASGTPALKRRATGFLQRAEALGVDVVISQNGVTSYETGIAAARELLGAAADARPDGVFCATDLIAFGFLDAARQEVGLRVPDDLCVIGYDDVPQAAWSSYRLTTFRQAQERIAAAIVESIVNPSQPSNHLTTIPVELIERDTVRQALSG